MNETTAMWLVILATLIFTITMIVYNVKYLFRQDKSVLGVVFGLDNIRFTLMFMSFISTLFLLVEAGGVFLSEYKLTTTQTTLSFFGVISLSLFVSLVISSMLVSAERTFGEGGLVPKKRFAVATIYAIVAVIDFSTISLGYGMVSSGLEAKKITKLDKKQDVTTSFIMSNRRDVGQSVKTQINSIQTQIDNINSAGLIRTKRVRTLKATLVRCAKKHKPCPDTNAELAQITKKQHTKKIEKMVKKMSVLQAKLLRITDAYEHTSNTIKQAKIDEIQSIKEKSESNKSTANTVAFFMIVFALIISVLRSVLNEDTEEKEVVEVNEDIKDKRHYVLEAMKIKAKDTQMGIDEFGSAESLHFGRDAMRTKAIFLAKQDKKLLALSKDATAELISTLKKRGGELEQWLTDKSWNQFKEYDSNYSDDLIAQ